MGNKEEGRRQFSHPLTPGRPTDREKRFQTNPNICCLGQESVIMPGEETWLALMCPKSHLEGLSQPLRQAMECGLMQLWGGGTLITESNGRCPHRP